MNYNMRAVLCYHEDIIINLLSWITRSTALDGTLSTQHVYLSLTSKRNQRGNEKLPFGLVFRVQLNLGQTQAVIKTNKNTKNRKNFFFFFIKTYVSWGWVQHSKQKYICFVNGLVQWEAVFFLPFGFSDNHTRPSGEGAIFYVLNSDKLSTKLKTFYSYKNNCSAK